MDIVITATILSILATFLLIIRPLTALLHELGHAIPALLLTKDRVTIYIGSYGDPKKSLRIRIARLEIWLRTNPIYWQRGLYRLHAQQQSNRQRLITILGGPLISFIIASICIYSAFAFDRHGAFKFFSILFFFSAVIDLLMNLIPYSQPIHLFDGNICYNDGYQLRELFQHDRIVKDYKNIASLYEAGSYNQVLRSAKWLMKTNIAPENIAYLLRMSIQCNIHLRRYTDAMAGFQKLQDIDQLNTDDQIDLSHLQNLLHQPDSSPNPEPRL